MKAITNSQSLRVAIYARYSTDRQDARSIDDQLRRCHAKATEQGFKVVAEYSDKAQSGAHLERADMQRLLADVRRAGAPPYSAVLVDDLSRLSRDLGNTWQIVFGDLAARGVRVIDVTTGMASDGAGARLTFGALALVNDTFLQLVKAETHRGLEGRALAGFWTGGRVYGYRTIEEEQPQDPEHPRKLPVIDEEEAARIRRVFELSAEGVGARAIAARLNAESVEAPYDKDYSKRGGKGWGASTITAMLQNERYMGKWVWNKRKWISASGKKSKRAITRPESEWVVREVPELAIVSRELWNRVKDRREGRRKQSRGRIHGEGIFPHALSGLLKCGLCNNSMSIVSAREKDGHRYANFGCSARHSKGSFACTNAVVVSELKVMNAVFATVREMLLDPRFAAAFLKGFEQRLTEAKRRSTNDDGAKEVRKLEKRVENLAAAVADAGWSEALGKQLRVEEERLRDARAALAPKAEDLAPVVAALSEEKLQKHFERLAKLTEKAPAEGKRALEGWFGPVTMTPKTENGETFYEAKGSIKLDPATLGDGRVVDKTSCGGRI